MDTASTKSKYKDSIIAKAIELGFSACGFAQVEEVDALAISRYEQWIATGKHDEMEYMERYTDIRNNPALLLDGARTVICLALNYYPHTFQSSENPQFAYYAYGRDYHKVIRKKLKQLSAFINEISGATSRGCVDTAPIRERYWAMKSGIGFVGRNNQLIIPSKGSFFFLAELITTLDITPDAPCTLTCGDCNRCVEGCPASALNQEGALDARQCLSCLTIEHRTTLPNNIQIGNRIYGCDECQKVCPHNQCATATTIDEFAPSDKFLSLTHQSLTQMTPSEFESTFAHSAIKRISLTKLKETLTHLS